MVTWEFGQQESQTIVRIEQRGKILPVPGEAGEAANTKESITCCWRRVTPFFEKFWIYLKRIFEYLKNGYVTSKA